MFLEECFDRVCNLTDAEPGTVTCIAGYDTRKEFGKNYKLPNHEIDPNFQRDCKLLNLVPCGKLLLPLKSVYELSLYCYSYYKIVENKICAKKYVNFKEIYDMPQFDIENHESVFRRLVHCYKTTEKQSKIKRKRISND